MKRGFRALALAAALSCAFSGMARAQDGGNEVVPFRGYTPFSEGWMYALGDDGTRASGGIEGSEWKPAPPRSVIPLGKDGWVWMAKTFVVSPGTALEGLHLALGRHRPPTEIYLNGSLISFRGSFPPGDYVQMMKPYVVLLPPGLLRPGGENLLSMRMHYRGKELPLSEIFLADEGAAAFENDVADFFNTRIYLIFAAVSLFSGLFFLAQFARRPKDATNLFFAVSGIFVSFYFAEMGAQAAPFKIWALKLVAKASLNVSLAALALFFLEFYGERRKRAFLVPILTLAAVSSILIMSSPDETTFNEFFKYTLVVTLIFILISLFVVTKAFARGNRGAGITLAGCVIGIVTGVHDAAALIAGREPVAWLQGIGFFCLILAMFYDLAAKFAGGFNRQERYREEVMAKTRELAATNAAIERFVPAEFLEFLGRSSIRDIRLGDHVSRTMTILSCDIRAFTALSERLSAEQNFAFLNNFVKRMAPVIREEGGIIDKYVGDSITALFPDDALKACRAARRMRKALEGYNEGRARAGYPPIEFGMGIHGGKLILGTVGEENRMDTTVISEAVDVTRKLQEMTREYDVPVIVSGRVIESCPAIREEFPARYIGLVTMKGRSVAVPAYELIFSPPSLEAQKIACRERFEQGVFLSDLGETERAKDIFESLLPRAPKDTVLKYFLDRD